MKKTKKTEYSKEHPRTIPASELSIIKMTTGGEKRLSKVIDNGVVKDWVGIGWVDYCLATEADYRKYPVVVRENEAAKAETVKKKNGKKTISSSR